MGSGVFRPARGPRKEKPMLVFVSIAIAAFLLLTFSFLFGHDLDHDADHSVDHGDASHDGTISIFSTKVLGTLMMGFGAAGAVARHYECSYLRSSLIGVGFGLLLAAVMYGFLSLIAKQQASSVFSTRSLVGCTGVVTVPIGADSAGEVGMSFNGRYTNYPANSAGGAAIAKGRTIKVVKAVGGQVIVEEAA
jgi:membrane protein implicated in regulation of membrane protease activity